ARWTNPRAMSIRPARTGEAALLTALGLRSKASWGYTEDFMRACAEELTIDEEELDDVFVKTIGEHVVGFYSLDRISSDRVELGLLFVEPSWMRRGFGGELLGDARERARALGYQTLVIQGDPHAMPFYRSAGAVLVGTRESDSIAGRLLPLFELAL